MLKCAPEACTMTRDTAYSSIGDTNLKTLNSAVNFTNWLYSEIKPYLFRNILELGSGIGTYSEKVVRDFKESTIILSDIDENYVNTLENRFKSYKNVIVKKIDLTKQDDFKNINITVDSVFALNLLEHVEDDVAALNNIYNVLKTGGNLIILVPAHKFLFNCIDKAVGHYRRYAQKDIVHMVKQTNFKIVKLFYFNFATIPGWYINGNVFRQSKVNEGAVGIFDKVVPILRVIERYVLLRKLGVSLIAVLSKQD
jgi:SAM-dependent methyltransferase